MSGGYFGYLQFRLKYDVIERLEELIKKNPDGYSQDVLNKFRECLINFEEGVELLHQIDRLVCGDYSEDSFWEQISETRCN